MGQINHHLSDTLLMAYAAGTLPEAFSVVVAAHVSLCDDCRARLAAYETVGGAVLETCDTVGMASGSFEATMARILNDPQPAARPEPIRQSVLPAPVRDYVGGDLSAVRWRSVGGGIRQSILPTSKDASVRLLSIPGGMKMPDHGHRGMEITMVLQGAFRDEDERFARGDVEIADEHLEHTPIAEEGEECICLAATDGPLRFNALLPRIAQPFLRI